MAANQDSDGLFESAPHYHGHRERLRARFRDAGPDALSDYELLELLLFQILQIEQGVVCPFGDANELIELDLESLGITVLSALNQEHHEKRDDGRARVDHELPRVRVMEETSGRGPDHDRREGRDERERMAHAMRLAVEAGRAAHGAGRIPRRYWAKASSPDPDPS